MDPEVKSVQFDSSLSGRERMEVRNQFQTLTFPVQSVPGLLSPVLYCGTELADRGQVHEMCERLGLGHESEGQGKEVSCHTHPEIRHAKLLCWYQRLFGDHS